MCETESDKTLKAIASIHRVLHWQSDNPRRNEALFSDASNAAIATLRRNDRRIGISEVQSNALDMQHYTR